MSVCCDCCVLSGRGLCDGLITRPEESYRLWCVVVCDLETSRMRRPWPALGRSATWNNNNNNYNICICWCVTEINYRMHRATVKTADFIHIAAEIWNQAKVKFFFPILAIWESGVGEKWYHSTYSNLGTGRIWQWSSSLGGYFKPE